jgi:hypothetical protein
MMLGIGVEQSPNHALVLGVMLAGLPFEVLNASLTERDGHFDSFVQKNQFLGARQEVRNDSQVSERFVCVLYSSAHKCACPSASNRLRKSG